MDNIGYVFLAFLVTNRVSISASLVSTLVWFLQTSFVFGVPIHMGTNTTAGNQQKHLSLSFAAKA